MPPHPPRRRGPQRPGPAAPVPPPPRSYWPHFRSVLGELLMRRVAGWRLTALLVILVGGLGGGQAVADAAGVEREWSVAGLQALALVGLTLLVAALVAAGRWRNARRR